MSAKNVSLLLSLFVAFFVLGCNLPGGASTTQEKQEENTATPTITLTATPALSETPTAPIAAACKPTVTTSVVANVRGGPGQVYAVIGTLPQGGTANVAGKSYDNAWWYIEFPAGIGGFAWIAESVTSATCIPDTLASIAAPPAPVAPTGVPNTEVVEASSPTPVSGGGITIIKIPPLLLVNSPTPTKIKFILNPPIIIQPVGP